MKLEIHPKAKALIFDLDGTLSDSLPVHIASWHTVCEKLNCTFDEKILVEMTGAPTLSFAERIIKEQTLAVDAESIVVTKHSAFRFLCRVYFRKQDIGFQAECPGSKGLLFRAFHKPGGKHHRQGIVDFERRFNKTGCRRFKQTWQFNG